MNRREFLAVALAAPFLLAASPSAFARRLGGTPLALVTADTEAEVVAVELASGRIARRLPTLEGPRSIESVLGTTAVVAHTSEGSVSLIDAPSLRVWRVLRAFSEPRYTAAAPGGRHAYVTDSGRGELVVLDLERGRVVHRTELGGPARHVTLGRDGTLWTALGSKALEVVLVDTREPERPRLSRRLRPPFLAHDVGFTPDGRQVWVTSGDSRRIAVYDAASLRLRFTLSADAPPQHVAFADTVAYVTSGDDATLRVHRLRDGKLLRTTAVPVGSYNVSLGWGRVLTPSLERGTLCVLDEAGRRVEVVRVAPAAHDACFVMSV